MESPNLEPLLRDDATDAERRLLLAAKRDAARPGARDEMLTALGVAAAPAPERFAERFGRLLGTSGGSLLHAVAFVVAFGALTGAALTYSGATKRASVADAPAEPSTSATTGEVTVLPEALEPASFGSEAARSLTTATAEAPPAVTPDALPSVPATAKAKAQAPTDTLDRETARVDAARAALARHQAPRALALLDAYEREFSPGAFAVEVSVLRIEALADAGRVQEARRLGERFLSEHRQGAFARRVAATLESLPDTVPQAASPRPAAE